MKVSRRILPIIIVSQFFCTSIWFAGNAVMHNLITDFGLVDTDLGHLTSAVQFGFICGTLLYALLTISDRYSPSKVFLISAVLGAIANAAIIWDGHIFSTVLLCRFLTGFFLAGIYPVGMKIAADYYEVGLGKSLSFLVGALVLGTALPHLLKEFLSELSWHYVMFGTSTMSVLGGVLIFYFVPDGPYRKASLRIDLSMIFKVFRNAKFNKVAFGYFGHMWELYAFWTFVPLMLAYFLNEHASNSFSQSLFSFFIIGIGSIACVIGGYWSKKVGNRKIASYALIGSAICCCLSPFFFSQPSTEVFLIFMLIWGMVVIADSPQLSTMVADLSDPEIKGTALTLVNCIGFAITIVSIELLSILIELINFKYVFLVLVAGPILGITALVKSKIKF